MTKYFLLLAAFLLAAPSYAEFTTNFGAATKYAFRGVQQSDQDMVIKAGLDYSAPWGLYAGAWGYTGSIEDFDTSEVNAYGGFAFSLWDVALGLGAVRYERAQQTGVTEYTASLAWDAYRFSTFQDEDSNQYHEVAASYDFWGENGLSFVVGMTELDGQTDQTFNYGVSWILAMPNQVDVEIGVTRHDDDGNTFVIGMTQQFDW
jgi:uncharacterized protein (TIGR02001 family)